MRSVMKSGPRHLGSKNLILFRTGERDYKLPRLEENEQELTEQLDATLSPEEKSFVFHYLRYADALLKPPDEKAVDFFERRHGNLPEMNHEYGLSAQNDESEEEDDGPVRFSAA
ncbi:MAG TPA: hypothetical protein VKT33_11875 [Candidatus Angelobacter sp.]|nr:hypothetical protein [Candidatus Angelobacter sp.]